MVADTSGPLAFARYAFPPNSHGYCGPGDHGAFFEYGVSADDRGLRAMSRQFEGAWPYLELIAEANGLSDPLDRRVVDAYWVGNRLLDHVSISQVGNSVENRFRAIAGPRFSTLAESVLAGAVPHHSFAVFCIYPWTGLLGDGRASDHALHVLDRCRIRWGKVRVMQGDEVLVDVAPLTWDGRQLGFGPVETETAVRSVEGAGMIDELHIGDWVALHWEWVCDRLTERQVAFLRSFTARHIKIVNEGNLHSGPATLLGT